MNNQFQRLEIMFKEQLKDIQDHTIAIIGLGGVGSFAAEAIARCGFNKIVLIDKDDVDITNLNRQLVALHSTIGKSKVEVMKDRILDINPNCEVIALKMFFNDENKALLFNEKVDFIIDACDTIEAKMLIIKESLLHQIPFVCSMGAANKIHSEKVSLTTLDKTTTDPIAKVLRGMVKKERIKAKIPVVFSNEQPFKVEYDGDTSKHRKSLPLLSSNAFVPSVFGLVCANYCFNYFSEIIVQKEELPEVDLIIPTMNDKEAVMKYKEDFIKHNDTLNGTGYLDELNTYEEWLKDTYGSMDKATVKDEWVCSIQYLAYNKKKQLVGMAQLRLDLNDFLKEYGGHIGLSVAREFRNQKYAKSILKDMIYMAKQSGINPIMISCDTNNVYSKKLILSCNAQFIETRYCSQFDINVDVFNIYY